MLPSTLADHVVVNLAEPAVVATKVKSWLHNATELSEQLTSGFGTHMEFLIPGSARSNMQAPLSHNRARNRGVIR
jgi:hypothetical protein